MIAAMAGTTNARARATTNSATTVSVKLLACTALNGEMRCVVNRVMNCAIRRVIRRVIHRAKNLITTLHRSIHSLTLLAITFLCAGTVAAASADWPAPKLPDGIDSFNVGDQITVNGLPMRLRGFVSAKRPAALLDEFRFSLGKPLVENTVGTKTVLGRAEGGFYVSVEVEPTGTGSKGVVAVTDLKTMMQQHAQRATDNARWLDRLPPGSSIASQMTSSDAGRAANHIVIVNTHSERLNSDALTSLMRADGYQLEPESASTTTLPRGTSASQASAQTLYFKAPGKEAMAVIARDGDKTSIVLNTVVKLGAFK